MSDFWALASQHRNPRRAGFRNLPPKAVTAATPLVTINHYGLEAWLVAMN
jgi:hypothetical protein